MNFIIGMITGAALTVGGAWVCAKYLDKTGQLMEFEEIMKASAEHLGGQAVLIPNHFPVLLDEEVPGKKYIEVDKIRLVVEDDKLVGWYQHE